MTTPTGAPEPMYCRTCDRALNIRTSTLGGPTEYLHAAELRGQRVDHPADPIPLSQLGAAARMECDACSTPAPSYVYSFGEQTTTHDPVVQRVVARGDYLTRHGAARTRRITTAPGITQNWGERWALCGPCGACIDTGDVYGLVGRVCDAMPAKYTRGNRLARVRGELHATYTHLIATRQPGRGVITAEHPLGVWTTNQKEES
jgi:hypothetical protein